MRMTSSLPKCVYQEQTLLQSRSHRSMHPALQTVLHNLFQWIEDHRRQLCLLRGTHRFRGSRKRILLCSGSQRKTILFKWKALRTAIRTEIKATRLAVVLHSLLCGENWCSKLQNPLSSSRSRQKWCSKPQNPLRSSRTRQKWCSKPQHSLLLHPLCQWCRQPLLHPLCLWCRQPLLQSMTPSVVLHSLLLHPLCLWC